MVGDMLTIAINERTSAGKSAANSASKSGSVDFSAPKVFGIPATTTAKLGINAETANTFEDKGTSTSSNTFSGTIAVTVVEVLPNGNLVVSGEKQVALDKGFMPDVPGQSTLKRYGQAAGQLVPPSNNVPKQP